LLLRREAAPGATKAAKWRVRNLLGANWLQPVFEQKETNWIAYNTAFPIGGDNFLVQGQSVADKERNAVFRVFSIHDGAQVLELHSKANLGQCSPLMDPRGRFLAFPPEVGNRVQLIRLPGSNLVHWIDAPSAISPSGDVFAIASRNGGCLLYGGSGQTNGLTLGMDRPMTLMPEFSPDGSRLAWGTTDGTVLVANLEEVRRRLGQLQTRRW
jgi:hypothetical protein